MPDNYNPGGWTVMTLAFLGKLAITVSFGIVYVLTAEIFPTEVRTTGLGSSSCVARAGAMAAPWIALLGIFITSYKEFKRC